MRPTKITITTDQRHLIDTLTKETILSLIDHYAFKMLSSNNSNNVVLGDFLENTVIEMKSLSSTHNSNTADSDSYPFDINLLRCLNDSREYAAKMDNTSLLNLLNKFFTELQPMLKASSSIPDNILSSGNFIFGIFAKLSSSKNLITTLLKQINDIRAELFLPTYNIDSLLTYVHNGLSLANGMA